jgi:enterochelin esterase-like enzyme
VLLSLAGERPDDLAAALAHAHACGTCRTMAAEMEATWNRLGEWTVPPAPAAAEPLVRARLGTDMHRRSRWPIAAAAVLGLLGGLGLPRLGSGQDDGRARFLLLLRRGPEAVNPDSGPLFGKMVAEYAAWREELADRGVLVASDLLDARSGISLHASPDSVTAGSGPQLDRDGGYVSGYYLIAATDLGAAEAVARTSPHLSYGGSIEVRPVVRAPDRDQAEPRVIEIDVPAPGLADNLLGDPASRRTLVALPASYDRDRSRRYPVLYLLHAFGVGPESWRGIDGYERMDVAAALDSLATAGAVEEMIVVMPDARTRYGGSWYARSPATGDWEAFIANELTAFVDSVFRTRPRRAARALAGQSMGAYGALRIGSARPDVFATIIAIGAPHIVNPNPLGNAAVAAARETTSPDAVSRGSPLQAVIWSKAAAFSPTSEGPFYAELPESAEVWMKWQAATIAGLLADPARADGLRRTTVLLGIGRDDPLRNETVALADTLAARDISHELVEFAGGHTAGVRAHFLETVLPFASRRLTR